MPQKFSKPNRKYCRIVKMPVSLAVNDLNVIEPPKDQQTLQPYVAKLPILSKLNGPMLSMNAFDDKRHQDGKPKNRTVKKNYWAKRCNEKLFQSVKHQTIVSLRKIATPRTQECHGT